MLSKQNIQNIYTLSPMQEGMYFYWLYEKSSAYFEQVSCHINGGLNLDYVKSSFKELLKRYDILRTVFTNKSDKKIIQIVLKERDIDFYYEDITQKENKDKYIIDFRERDRKRSFDLSKDILIRASVLKINENEYEFIWSFHHILIDGWCLGILLSEFFEIYNSYIEGRTYVLPKVKQYREYIKWLEKQDKELSRRYWNRYLNDYEEAAVVPCSNLNKGNVESDNHYNYKQGIVIFEINKRKSSTFRELAIRNNVTLNTVFQMIWGILLGRYNNKNDVVFGSVVSGRPSEIDGVEAMVGLFINTVPIRIKYEENIRFNELLNKVQENAIESESYHYYPLAEIQSESQLKQNLIDHIVVFENYPIDLKFDGVFSSKSKNKSDKEGNNRFIIDDIEVFDQTNYDFNIIIAPGELLEVKFIYNQNKYSTELVESISNHFIQLFNQVLLDDALYIHELTILPSKEREQLLNEFNDTEVDYPRDKTIQELFEDQVERTPGNIAIVFEDQSLTYRILSERANQLGRVLKKQGVEANSIVGIMVYRSLEMIIGIFGILKAEGAYLPMEPEYPTERKEYILKESGAKLLLTQNIYINHLKDCVGLIDLDDGSLYRGDSKNLEKINRSNDLAYVIYTSGSTGFPKGVLVDHRSILNTLFSLNQKYPFIRSDVYLLKTSYIFDVSVSEIFCWFFCGGKLSILEKDAEKDPLRILDAIRNYSITHINFVPSMFNAFVDFLDDENVKNMSGLKYIFLAGEVLYPAIIKKFRAFNLKCQLENIYGPTEASIYGSWYSLSDWKGGSNIPIGRPLYNVELYILDTFNNIQPVGVVGELCICGEGLARGYLNNIELTKDKFEINLFEFDKRKYMTGDLARYLSDGNIEFLGRVDDQVKIRGFRIELGEIESQLLKHELIGDAIVLSRVDGKRNKYLCAYIVSKKAKRQEGTDLKSKRDESTSAIDISELRDYLSRSLPEYMVPSYFVEIDNIPLTPSGKIDRKSLPEPDKVSGEEYVAPRNKLERELVEIWSDVLNVEREIIGIDSNFLELGGHSLKATILISKIHKVLNVEVPLAEVFKRSKIRGLADYIKNRSKRYKYESINTVEKKEFYECTSAQKRIHFLHQFDLENTSYNMPNVLALEGKVDRNKTAETFKKLILRHDSLRTSFEVIEGEPVQKIHKNVEFEIEAFKVKGESFRKGRENVIEIIERFVQPFDLSRPPLLRVGIIESEGNHLLLIDMHHIISDGVSYQILKEEFERLYAGNNLRGLRLQYRDYAFWQISKEQKEQIKEQEAYWLNKYSGEVPVLHIPTDYSRPVIQSFEGSTINFEIGSQETQSLIGVGKSFDVTLFMILLAVYNILLSKLSGQEEIVVGTPIAGRRHADLEDIIGIFLNILPLRSHIPGEKTFIECLEELKGNTLNAFENQEYPFEDLVEKIEVNRDTSRNPLFDVMFVLQNMDISDVEIPGLTLRAYDYENKTSKFDLTLQAIETEDNLLFTLEYCTKLFKQETIERFITYFKKIVSLIGVESDVKISEIEIITEKEKKKILYHFNDTEITFPGDITILKLFEDQVERSPHSVGLIFEDQQLTYRELDNKSHQLAKTLIEKGVQSNTIVGIMVKRSLDMLIGIYGIIKAGGAYLPISPEDPDVRKKYIIENSGAVLLLTQGQYFQEVAGLCDRLDLRDSKLYSNTYKKAGDNDNSKSSDLVYVIYTSGSTGNPKGVMIEHKSLVNRLNWMQNKYLIGSSDTLLQKTPFTFDVSVWELFWWSLGGARLCILSPGGEKDFQILVEAIEKERVTLIHFVPSMLKVFLESLRVTGTSTSLSSLRDVICSGESLSLSEVTLFKELLSDCNRVRLSNLYGPTEATVDVSYFECIEKDKSGAIPIGKPIDNIKLYVLNREGQCQPQGIKGELYISGVGLGRGYLNEPGLTGDKYETNLFLEGERAYRTGDLARWMSGSDGNLEFLGRIDHQVKIRGNRIELGEIESHLLSFEEIKDAIVIIRNDSRDKYLCAYFVSDREQSAALLKEYLSQSLPGYMIPSYFVQIDKIPLTVNGKIDRRALPEPEVVSGEEYIAPRNEIEMKLVGIWSEVLGVEKRVIGLDSNFFELGGHSLKATMMVSKIHRELDVRIPLAEIFRSLTIRALFEYIKKTKRDKYASINSVEKREYYKLSSAQKRLYVLQQIDLESIAYNMPMVLPLAKNIEIERLEKAFNRLIVRHESLRTSFNMLNDVPVQTIQKNVNFKIAYNHSQKREEITDKNKRCEPLCSPDDVKEIVKNFVKPFDLSRAPLLRVGFIEVSEEENILLLDMNHIITDGSSGEILTREFMPIYSGEELMPLRLQYKDYSQWQNNWKQQEIMKNQEEYWLKIYSDSEELPILNLPTDYPRPSMQSFEGAAVNFVLCNEETRVIKEIARTSDVTLYMSILSIFTILLSKLSSQEDIVVGTAVAGRRHSNLEDIIGMFVNTLAIRSYPHGSKRFREFLDELKESTLEAFENQEYQFEDLVDKITLNRDTSRNPVFDVMFSLQNQEESSESEELFSTDEKVFYNYTAVSAKFDLSLEAIEFGDSLHFTMNYCTELFKPSTIDRIIEYFRKIISGLSVSESRDQKLSEIEMILPEEKQEILYEFNDTDVEYPKNKTIHQLFEEQVCQTPENVAVVYGDRAVTYRELNQRSNQLARVLRDRGVEPDTIVGIMVGKSVEMIIGLLGILKAGGAYLPIDPKYPESRNRYIIEDSGVTILLSQRRLSNKTEILSHLSYSVDILFLDDEDKYFGWDSNLPYNNLPSDLAYIIYTSGSTGKPKGVMIGHQNVIRLVRTSNYIEFKDGDRLLLTGSISFDITTFEIWGPLLNKVILYLVSESEILEVDRLFECIEKNRISILHLIPQLFNQMSVQNIKMFSGLRYFLVGGDLVRPDNINLVRDAYKDLRIVHMYGPTENTTFSTSFIVNRDYEKSIPLGGPISNSTVYILDTFDKLQPAGVVGEICTGGAGVSRGYLNRLELTKEKFVEILYRDEERIYKTGDLGKWLSDGSLEFLGRSDNQVKVRGYRIELGEIQSQLLRFEEIKDAIVIIRDDNSRDKYLCAYFISDREQSAAVIKEYLSEILPGYMIPSYFIQIDKIPLTVNGKIDRNALPTPEVISGEEYVAPGNEKEERLCNVYSEVLGIDKVGIYDSFFEIGGDSIKAIQITSKLQRYKFKLKVADMFRYPKISDLSKHIQLLERKIDQGSVKGEISLTPIQRWFFSNNYTDRFHFNHSVMLYRRDGFDIGILERLFTRITEHHDALRIIYKREKNKIVQINKGVKGNHFDLQVFDLKEISDYSESIRDKASEIQASINLFKGPLLKLGCFKTGDGDHLLIVIHHLVIDGISWRILLEDISSGYEQADQGKEIRFQSKTDSFMYWSEQQKKYSESQKLLKEISFWRHIEDTDVDPLPRDHEIESSQRILRNQETSVVLLNKEETDKLLRECNRSYITEINDLLLTALGLSVNEWSGGISKILINLEGHGREEIIEGVDISRTVGWLTSQYPVLLEIGNSEDISYMIRYVKESLRRIPNKGIGYGILRYLTPGDKREGLEFFSHPEISFNYLGEFSGGSTGKSIFSMSGMPQGDSISSNLETDYTININGMTAEGQLSLSFSYNKYEYKKETIEELCSLYKKFLLLIINHCLSREKVEKTPSDLGCGLLSLEEFFKIEKHIYTKIDKGAEIKTIYPLSPMQSGMLFHSLMDSSSMSYLTRNTIFLKGTIDIKILEESFNRVIARYDIFRTLFIHEGINEPLQVVLSERSLKVEYYDISEFDDKGRDNYIEEFKELDKKNILNLSIDHLFRVSLIKTSERRYCLVWDFHHILMDGWCLSIIYNEVMQLYCGLSRGQRVALKEVKPYRDYIDWLNEQGREEGIEYWKVYLSEYEERSILPQKIKGSTEDEDVYDLRELIFDLDEGVSEALNKIAKSNNVTINTLFQVIWGLLLHRYNNNWDSVFGVVVAGRSSGIEGIEEMIGLFINTIPVRIIVEKGDIFVDLLQRVQKESIESKHYEYLPLSEVQSLTELKSELIDHIMVFENYPISDELKRLEGQLDLGFVIERFESYEQTNYDFNIIIVPGRRIKFKFNYNGNRYTKETIEHIVIHLKNLIRNILEEPGQRLSRLEILSEKERHRLLVEFNATEVEYPKDTTIHQLFEEQVERTPDHKAVIFGDKELTYDELNKKANRLARLLRMKGVSPDFITGIMVDRSLEMIIGILAILKAGGAYLPIDIESPAKRVKYILEDSGASLLLIKENTLDQFSITSLKDNKALKLEPVKTPPCQQIKDFDNLPHPDRTIIDYKKYHKDIGIAMAKHTVSIQATRGCPFNCAFCHKIWPKKHIVRSAENIFKEIQNCYKAGVSRFVFIDDIFNLDQTNSMRLFEKIIEHQLDIQLFFPNGLRGDILTKEFIDLMVKAGTVNIDLALESASPRIQKLIGKNLNLNQLKENILYIAQTYPHVILELELIIGFPTETKEEAFMTLDFLKSLKWVHFPNLNILKIYPQTDMYRIAIENGISEESIKHSVNLAYHELPETLPFSKDFVKEIQSRFLSEYFLLKERLLNILPYQTKKFTEDEIIQKYDSYLPEDIRKFSDILQLADIKAGELGDITFLPDRYRIAPDFNENMRRVFPLKEKKKDAFNILLVDLSLLFSTQTENTLYDMIEEPLGLIYLMSYLNVKFGENIKGKVIKSRIDFDNYEELLRIISEFKPDLIGLRTLSYYKDFLHSTVLMIRHMGLRIPIIVGGPYATSEYAQMLQDVNIDLAVLGEGELILAELIEKMISNYHRMPDENILQTINGIAFLDKKGKLFRKESNRDILLLDRVSYALPGYSTNNLENINKGSDLIYMVYTSGSTGKPKGVMLEHTNVVNLIRYDQIYTNIDFNKILQFHTIGFDASFHEIFCALSSGGELYLIDNETRSSIPGLLKLVGKNKIQTLFLPMSLLTVIFNEEYNIKLIPNCVKHIQTAGEQVVISNKFSNYLEANNVYLHNHYGPAETHVVTALTIDPEGEGDIEELPSIGRPILNTRIYILDKGDHLVPKGVSGELSIGGEQVGRGYLGQAELTEEKFINSPFENEGKIYKTGDLARWREDGNIDFLGRIDHQVKIRGFRIEPGEIETQLLNHESIQEVVVLCREDKGREKYLCAYMVSANDIDITDIRRYLSRLLPDYMLPSYFIQMDKIPITPNGKIDRKALPDPELKLERTYTAPRNTIEEKLAEIWSEVLMIDKGIIGIDSNFFELGGHSLKATILVSKIHKALNVRLQLGEIFKTPTIRVLSNYLNEAVEDRYASIEILEEKEYYQLSSAQRRLYVLNQMDKESIGYNMPSAVILEGSVDTVKLEDTFEKLIKRHESLRASFELVGDEPIQRIHNHADFSISYFGIGEDCGSSIAETIENFITPFDLSKAPLLSVGLIKEEEEKYILIVDMHHIISDGTSMDIIINDFMSLYNDTNLPVQGIQYKEYVGWQNRLENMEIIIKQEEYWLNKYSGEIPVLDLPTDYSRPVIQSFEGSSINFEIGRQETQSLRDAAKSFDVTLFMILLTAFNILLSKLADQEEIIVGTPIAGRRHADLEDIIGIFLNTLPIRSHIPGERTFIECLEELKGNTLIAFENQEYPFEDLVEKVEVNRDTSRNPIFDVMLVLQNMDISELEIPGLKLKPFDYENKTSKFDLTLQAMETEDNLLFTLEYCTKLFKQKTIERFIAYFKKIVLLIAVESEVKISEIEIISEKEKNKIVYELNETESEYPHHLTIHELFEEKALVASDQWSVVSGSGDGSISFGELNKQANQLARSLRKKGVKPDTIVGIIAEPSIQMIVGILGILKSGGAYLPIERDNPGERIDLILNESRVEILLKTGELGRASEIDFKGEMIDLDDKEIYQGNHFNSGKISGPENLAYVIYTSGTTGRPKGVMIEHRSVVNYVWWAAKNYVRGETINFPLYTSLSFDLTVTSIFTPLITGNSIIVYGREDKELLIEKVMSDNDDRFGVIKLTPAHLKVIRDMKIESKVKRFIVGGEDLESKLARDINKKLNGPIEIFNEYGPTEATVGCMIYKFNPKTDKNKSVPIGIAADNAKIYILDKRQKPVPMGVNGEIFISGEGVSRGYLNNLELTEEKFIIDSYDSGKKMYRSGDLGRWLPEGNIEFFGRVDDQVKIKGFRIELGDIESQLLGIDYIKEALVIDREDGEDKYLCAYIVSVSDIEIDISEIRNLLSDKLPDYMIPTRFMQIEKIPLTVNGKVDRRVLPAPEVVSGEEYAAPRDEKEETLCKVYSEVLGVDRVGINDNFFEVGGDSIKAIQITSRIQKYKLKLTVVDLFRHPKISDLSKYVGVLDREIDQGNVKGEISLTPIQRWFFSNSYTDSFHFNHSVMLYRREGFDIGILEKLFTRITEHHDALRIIYKKKENKIVQINKGVEGNHFDLKVFDLKEISNDSEFIRDKANEIQGSINLSEGPLLKLGCFKTGGGDHLLIVIHHLVIDGISWRILLEDISSGYEQADQGKEIRFQSKTDSFMYWSEQQKKYSESQKLLKEISFWRHIEETDIEPLPRDHEIESSQKRFRNQETSIVMLSKDETDKLLRECSRSYITEINDLLLTALGLSVNEWSGGITRILINLEGHGREEIIEGVDISRTVGWFTSQYPVLLEIENSEDISYMIRYVKESLRRIPNKGIGYGILRYLTPGDKREGLEFFSHPEISFNYLGEFSGGSTGKSIFSMSGMPPGDSISSNLETDYTININGMTAEGQLNLSFSYNKYEYKKETIEELCSLYKKYLRLIINHCLNQDKVKKTPSDLGDVDISIEELKEIESMF